MAYTDETKVENYLKRQLTAQELAFLPIAIAGIEAFINRYIGKSFAVTTTATDRYFDATGGRILEVDPATEITEVAVLNDYSDETGQLLAVDTDYHLYPLNASPKDRIYFIGGRYRTNAKRFRVKAKWGTSAVPDDIILAATIMAADNYTNPGNLKSESIEGYSRTWATDSNSNDLNPTVKRILDSYTTILIGS